MGEVTKIAPDVEDVIEDLVELLSTGKINRMICLIDGEELSETITFGTNPEWVPMLLEDAAAELRIGRMINDWEEE